MHVKYINLKQDSNQVSKNDAESMMSNLDIPFDIIE